MVTIADVHGGQKEYIVEGACVSTGTSFQCGCSFACHRRMIPEVQVCFAIRWVPHHSVLEVEGRYELVISAVDWKLVQHFERWGYRYKCDILSTSTCIDEDIFFS
jgi:hypothetical protein